jgi:single-strand DNA-binding protein
MADNNVTLTGNLTRDIELRFAAGSGAAIASFGLAVNARKKDDSGNWTDDPKFFDCVAFGDLGENAAESLTKGTRVIVVGRLDWSQWDDKDGGGKRSKVQIIVDGIGPDLRWATATVSKKAGKASSNHSTF